MNDIMKIIKSFEEFGLLIKDVSETTKNEPKEQTGALLSMLLGTLGTKLLVKHTWRNLTVKHTWTRIRLRHN